MLALERYGARRIRTPYVTATEQAGRLAKIATAAKRLAAAPENEKWRLRLVKAIDPLFIEDPSTADFANHVLVEFEAELGLTRPRGLPQFLQTLKSRTVLVGDDVGRCRALADVSAKRWGPESRWRYLPAPSSNADKVRDPHTQDVRDVHLIELVEELEGVWVDLTGKGVLAQDPVDKTVYFSKWLALVVRKATRGKLRPTPGSIAAAAEVIKSRKLDPV